MHRSAATAQPTDAALRLNYAAALSRAGFRAAATYELEAVKRYGGDLLDSRVNSISIASSFENPPGRHWVLLPFQAQELHVAPPWIDARFPGARVGCDGVELPLAVILGTPCTTCDAAGETVCGACDGTGTRYEGFDETEHPCPKHRLCVNCMGSKFSVNSYHAGKGACRHSTQLRVEFTHPRFNVIRCTDCGLAATRAEGQTAFACGACGHFDCICRAGKS
jgi:hypothetical protein